MTVPVVAHADHFAIENAHGREQRGGSVALVVVSHGSATPLLQRQTRLRAVQRLDLALLVGTEDDGVFLRVEVKSYAGVPVPRVPGIGTRLARPWQVWLPTNPMPHPP